MNKIMTSILALTLSINIMGTNPHKTLKIVKIKGKWHVMYFHKWNK